MGETTKNMLIGAFVILATAVFVSFILFLRPTVGDMEQTLNVRFSDINNIGIGTRVLYAGRPVGEVVALSEIPDARKQPVDEIGRVYIYQLTLKIDSGIKVYDVDEVTVQTSGLLGEKSIGIVPKAAPPGVISKRITDQPIYADSVDPLQNALVQVSEVANEMERAFKLAGDWIEKNDEALTAAVKNFGDAMEGGRNAINEMKEREAFSNISDVIKNLKVSTGNLSEGKGTLGRLINEDDLYLRFSSIMSKVDTVLGDISHYGLLFHTNRGWQRTRLKRITLLNALDTPEGFRSFFEDEFGQINLSMSRLSLLLQRAEESPDRESILESTPFRRDFQELKKEVDELAENLRLFNKQLRGSGQ